MEFLRQKKKIPYEFQKSLRCLPESYKKPACHLELFKFVLMPNNFLLMEYNELTMPLKYFLRESMPMYSFPNDVGCTSFSP